MKTHEFDSTTDFSSSHMPPYNFSTLSLSLTIFTPVEILALSISVAVLSFVGTMGNLLVIVSICNQDVNLSVSDNPTNLLLLSQAVADLLVSCAGGPAYIYTLYIPKARFVSASLGQLTGAASVGNLVLLTLNRFVSIRSPLKYPRIVTSIRTKAAIAFTWTISFIEGISTAVGFMTNVRKLTESSIYYLIPSFFFISGCYVYMFKKARYHQQEIKKVSYRSTGHQAGLEKDLKSVFSLLLVSGTFFVTWVPITIFVIVSDQYDNPIRYNRILLCLLPLLVLNSAMDPVIYYFRSAKFRQVLRRLKSNYRERRIRWENRGVLLHKKNYKIPRQVTPVQELETERRDSVFNSNSSNEAAAFSSRRSGPIEETGIDRGTLGKITVLKRNGYDDNAADFVGEYSKDNNAIHILQSKVSENENQGLQPTDDRLSA